MVSNASLGFATSTSFVNLGIDDDRTHAVTRTLDPVRGICVSSYDVAPIGFAPAGATHISLMTLQYATAWDGVAPAMAMIRDIADHGLDRRLHLIYGSRTSDDVIFRDALDALAAAHPNLRVDHVIADPGPGTWTRPDRSPSPCGRGPRDRPLLDVLEDQGVRPGAACRSGECSLCRVRIREGQVHNAEEARLRLSDERFGFTHSCVAYPLTDLELDLWPPGAVPSTAPPAGSRAGSWIRRRRGRRAGRSGRSVA